MSRIRFRKSRALGSKRTDKQREEPIQRIRVVGFPDFWETANEKHSRFFDIGGMLIETGEEFLRQRVEGKLCVVLHFMLGAVTNSLGALMTLALNGYGHDAVRIARSMFETAVNAEYLRRNPLEVEDFLDFHWVRVKQTLAYFERYAPQELRAISKTDLDEIDTEFTKVKHRFTNRNDQLRTSWCKQDFRKRCEAIGAAEYYPTFYQHASDFEHGNIHALAAQSATDAFTIEPAPSLKSVGTALRTAHLSFLIVIDALNKAGKLGRDDVLESSMKDFKHTWELAES